MPSRHTGVGPMDITFRKLPGEPASGILFFWSLKIATAGPATVCDDFIPDPYYDYIYIQRGQMQPAKPVRPAGSPLPAQTLRGLFTRPYRLNYSTPLQLFGARLALPFAETYWGPPLAANRFIEQAWVGRKPGSLPAFAAEVTRHIQAHRSRKYPHALLGPALDETAWLRQYSARHKRRLYLAVYGLPRQAIDRICRIHVFLEQLCNFEPHRPTVLQHVNPEVFYDQPHLNRAFKQTTGLSPLEYFFRPSHLQSNLMAASYNAPSGEGTKL